VPCLYNSTYVLERAASCLLPRQEQGEQHAFFPSYLTLSVRLGQAMRRGRPEEEGEKWVVLG
jgi:hypothetical protein